MFEQIQKILVGITTTAMANCTNDDSVNFKMLTGLKHNGEIKPLLILGRVNPKFLDGRCLGILNPDDALLAKLRPGVGYCSHYVRENLAKKCDCALGIWYIATNHNNKVLVDTKYKARKMKPAKFTVE